MWSTTASTGRLFTKELSRNASLSAVTWSTNAYVWHTGAVFCRDKGSRHNETMPNCLRGEGLVRRASARVEAAKVTWHAAALVGGRLKGRGFERDRGRVIIHRNVLVTGNYETSEHPETTSNLKARERVIFLTWQTHRLHNCGCGSSGVSEIKLHCCTVLPS